MTDARYKLTFMSLDDGHEWDKFYDSYEEVSFAYERALRSSYWQNIVGAYDPAGNPVKTLYELRREEERRIGEERAKVAAEIDARRFAEVMADPTERAIYAGMKWFFIIMGLGFVYSMFR